MKKYILTLMLSLSLVCSAGVAVAHAQAGGNGGTPVGGGNGGDVIKLNNPFSLACGNNSNGCDILDFLKAIKDNVIMPIGGVLAVLAFIWTGFRYVTAQGNPTKISKAHEALKYTVIGTALLVGANAITDVIIGTLNQL